MHSTAQYKDIFGLLSREKNHTIFGDHSPSLRFFGFFVVVSPSSQRWGSVKSQADNEKNKKLWLWFVSLHDTTSTLRQTCFDFLNFFELMVNATVQFRLDLEECASVMVCVCFRHKIEHGPSLTELEFLVLSLAPTIVD